MSSGKIKKYAINILDDGTIETKKVNIFTKCSDIVLASNNDTLFTLGVHRDGRIETVESFDTPVKELELDGYNINVDNDGRLITTKK